MLPGGRARLGLGLVAVASTVEQRTVDARWAGGMRAVVQAGDHEIIVDEPESAGGTNTGPQPTDLLLASIASCFTLSMAYAADKRGIELPGLRVRVVGTYEGLKFTRIELLIGSAGPSGVLEELISDAERVCYVTNTLRQAPEVRIELG
jgi:putative redox protein